MRWCRLAFFFCETEVFVDWSFLWKNVIEVVCRNEGFQ